MTDQSTTKSVMKHVHQTVQRVGLNTGTSLTTFLKFAIKMVEHLVKSKTTLARETHTTHLAARSCTAGRCLLVTVGLVTDC